MTRPIHVALDARKLHDGGIGTYIRELLAEYAKTPGADTCTALVEAEDVPRIPAPVRTRIVSAGKYGLAEHWRVPDAARATGAQLLHAPHFTLPMGWTGPSVVTVHDLIHLKMARFYPPHVPVVARAMIGAAVSRARIVLADSQCTRDDLREVFGLADDRVRVVPLGVSDVYAPASEAECRAYRVSRNLPEGYVLYVGARKGHKNLSLLLRAWAAMPGGDRPPLVLSGEPWRSDDPLAREAEDLRVLGSVRFSGRAHDDASGRMLYASAALYVQPAFYEGFGLPPVEAMACGTPVLSSDGGSLREVAGGGAELLSPDAHEPWAVRILALLGDGEARAAMRARGIEHAKQYRWEKTAAMTREAYREALG